LFRVERGSSLHPLKGSTPLHSGRTTKRVERQQRVRLPTVLYSSALVALDDQRNETPGRPSRRRGGRLGGRRQELEKRRGWIVVDIYVLEVGGEGRIDDVDEGVERFWHGGSRTLCVRAR